MWIFWIDCSQCSVFNAGVIALVNYSGMETPSDRNVAKWTKGVVRQCPLLTGIIK